MGTTPAGVAVLIGAGAVLGYLELKEVIQDIASVYDDTVIGGYAETILDLMMSFESQLRGYAKLAEDAIESALQSIPAIHFASGDSAIMKTEANQWLIGDEHSTLVGSDQSDFIVHFGSGEVLGRGGDDTLVAIMPDVLSPDDVLEMRGGAGDDWVMAFGGDGAKLYGGAGSDWVVGWSGQDRLWGGDGTVGGNGKYADDGAVDYFNISGNSIVMDAQADDYVSWGPLRLTGGVQQWWSESHWAYWSPMSSLVSSLGWLSVTTAKSFRPATKKAPRSCPICSFSSR